MCVGVGVGGGGGGGVGQAKRQNSHVVICGEASLLHNSQRKSHGRRIIVALSLRVLKVVIHHIHPPFFLLVFI